jgi:CBS domain-containing protein
MCFGDLCFFSRKEPLMLIRTVMTRGVAEVTPVATLHEAAEMMRTLDVGALPVCDGGRVVGMITDRDITIRAVADCADPRRTRVGAVMTPKVVFCFDDDDVDQAIQLMERKQVRRLVVMDHEKRAVGIVSLGDLATRLHQDELSGEVLVRISEPSPSAGLKV